MVSLDGEKAVREREAYLDISSIPRELTSNGAAMRAVHRLRLITGFATVYGVLKDPRLDSFARVWHVRRVVWFAELLAARFGVIDITRLRVLGWLHDLNRWPFAHNSEQNLFCQPANSPKFFRQLGILAENDIAEIVAIQEKRLGELSTEGKCVLLADAVVGMLEDPLLLITALRVRPEFLPDSLSQSIGFSYSEEPWRSRSLELARLAAPGASLDDMTAFRDRFDALLLDQSQLVIDHHVRDSMGGLEAAEPMLNLVQEVKAACHRPIIFPINNDLVSHGPWLRERVMPWYRSERSIDDLVFLSEYELVDRIVTAPDSPFEREEFLPDVDIVFRENPDLRFTGEYI